VSFIELKGVAEREKRERKKRRKGGKRVRPATDAKFRERGLYRVHDRAFTKYRRVLF
jgi:hypothetical protein